MRFRKPSLEDKKRYIGFYIESEERLGRKEVLNELWSTGLSFLGEAEMAETGFWVHDCFDDQLIVEVRDGYVDEILAVVSLVNEIKNERVRLDLLGVAGTIRKLKKSFILNQEK
ncbi:MAG: RNase P/RNase MRP subunit POP5 [Candidatus Methanohalarchaeum thermophilum]|uniref:Ribonuclease P protein component 2 n=1 Tax=Methanohalarchaeum thermophilum TaxID=1903181 RepID=A0A1Q6DVR1_METT1|nr:MAG: RNase P/RNase MRP subunit POP5 [Candidatus Methanohalarchaeum thermophilum]